MNKLYQGTVLAGLMVFAASSQATLISNTSQDGNHTSLTCLFNGEASASQCERPVDDGKTANVPASGWLTDTSDMNVNDEARVESTWQITSPDGASSQIVIQIAGNKNLNAFGIYNPSDTNQRIEVFAGADPDGSMQTISFVDGMFTVGGTTLDWGSDSFGFYIHNPNMPQAFFSDPNANPNGDVQMVAFEGDGQRHADFFNTGSSTTWERGQWILAWEDLPYASSDQDFNDFIVKVSSVRPVPEPMTLALLGIGLVGMGFVARRTRRTGGLTA